MRLRAALASLTDDETVDPKIRSLAIAGLERLDSEVIPENA